MTTNSNLEINQILSILIPYGITEIDSYSLLSGGSENSNYLIKTPYKNYVLTICEQKSLQKSQDLVALLDFLEQHQFHTSTAIKTVNENQEEGKGVTVYNNKAVMLKDFIEGSILDELPEQLLFPLGEQLAKLHSLNAPNYLPTDVSYSLSKFDEVKLYAADSDFYKWLVSTSQYIQNQINEELPKSLIHSDIFNSNIIANPDLKSATIMDFEEACFYYRVFDIGMMLVGTCCEKGQLFLPKAQSLLAGYQQSIKLEEIEIQALQAFTVYGATATAFWRHQNYHHINREEKMFDHYLGMKRIADQVLEIPKDQFISRLF